MGSLTKSERKVWKRILERGYGPAAAWRQMQNLFPHLEAMPTPRPRRRRRNMAV